MSLLLITLWAASDDVYSAAFREEVSARVAEGCRTKASSIVVAKPWTREQVWRVRRVTDAEHEGKQLYVQFLKDRYGYSIARVNELYGQDAGSFTELVTSDFRGTDRERAEVRADDEAFLSVLEEVVVRAVGVAWARGAGRIGAE